VDYYLVGESVVAEEFVLADDHTAVGLRSTRWAPDGTGWRGAAEFSRAMRADPEVRAKAVPVERADVEARTGALPDEEVFRACAELDPLGSAPVLRFGAEVPDRRVYRILFAGELDGHGAAALRARWGMDPVDDPRVVGRARVRDLMWELRRIGLGVAWCVDVTAYDGGGAVGTVLHELRTAARRYGLIPVTVERFS
jgi:hypothetical protein